MKNPYSEAMPLSIYDQEQRTFAKMKEEMQLRKRRQRRRRVVMWVLRRL